MLPAAYMPSESEEVPPIDTGGGSGDGSSEFEPDQLCPNCGQALPITEIAQTLLSELTEKIRLKQQRLATLKEEVARAKLSCRDSVELKGRLAEQWNEVLLARSRVRLTKRACEAEKKATKKELEEVQLLEKANRRRTERLKQVSGKDFSQKENTLLSEITEDQKRAAEKLNQVVEVRRSFLTELYTKIFPIEVLPLSVEDEGAEDYYDQTRIDCDRVLELDGGWVLGGVHQHPTPHISIVAPSLPASGDHTPYLSALQDRSKNKGAVPEKSVHPTSDPYLSTPAALVFVAQFVEVIGWVLDQPLPFPLHRPVAISEYGIPVKKRRSFLEAMAKLDDNIMYLCFSQHVPLSALSPGHTLQNLLALITHSQLGRTGAFECDGALACYDGSLNKKRRRHKNSSRGSPLLLSHDMDDSQPPKVSYASTHSLSSNSDEESTEDEDVGGGSPTPTESMVTSQYLDWEHLDPTIEDLWLFEEDQMRQALRNPAKRSSTTSPEQQRTACIQAQEAEIYRQRLRRLDYNSTYMEYAALTSTGSSGVGSSSASSPVGPLASATAAGDSFKSSASREEKHGQQVGKKAASDQTAESASVASGIFGTLSSLWTSTFGGSKS